jgi:MFS family permease
LRVCASRRPPADDVTQPAYRRLWTARTISQVGDVAQFTTLALLIVMLTGSGLGVSAVVLAEIVPVLLLAPLAGSIDDRLPRVKVMVAADLLRVVLAAVLAVWHDSPAVAYAVAFGFSAGQVFFSPAAQSVLPSVVRDDELLAANSGIWTAAVTAQIAVAPVAALLAVQVGFGPAFAVHAVSFALTAVVLRGLREPERTRPSLSAARSRMPARPSARSGRFRCSRPWPSGSSSPLCRPARLARCWLSWPRTALAPGRPTACSSRRSAPARRSGRSCCCEGSRTRVGRCSCSGHTPSVASSTSSSPSSPRCRSPPHLSSTGYRPAPAASRSAASCSPRVPEDLRGRAFAGFDVLWQSGRMLSLLGGGLLADAVGIRAVYLLGGLLLLAAAAVGAAASRHRTAPDV